MSIKYQVLKLPIGTEMPTLETIDFFSNDYITERFDNVDDVLNHLYFFLHYFDICLIFPVEVDE